MDVSASFRLRQEQIINEVEVVQTSMWQGKPRQPCASQWITYHMREFVDSSEAM